MPIHRKLTIVFLVFYLAVVIYLLLFFLVPDFQMVIIETRRNLAINTNGSHYIWAIIIALGICFLGSASIGFPVPFPFVLFSLSNSLILSYMNQGLILPEILVLSYFWIEILGIAIAGGLGCILGEVTGYAVGYGAKKIVEGTESDLLKNLNGFGKMIFTHRRRIPIYVFLFAVTPLPDDILFLPLGMMKYPFWKCIIPGWIGKTLTTIFYCIWPILIALGLMATGIEANDLSNIISEALLLLVTITIMFFIMAFDWNKYAEDKRK